jgi:hypothetical protein
VSKNEDEVEDRALARLSGLVRRGDTRQLGERDNLGTQRAHEATMHDEEETRRNDRTAKVRR